MSTGAIVALSLGGLALAGGGIYLATRPKQAGTTPGTPPKAAPGGVLGTVSSVLSIGTQAAGFVDTTSHAVSDVSDAFSSLST